MLTKILLHFIIQLTILFAIPYICTAKKIKNPKTLNQSVFFVEK